MVFGDMRSGVNFRLSAGWEITKRNGRPVFRGPDGTIYNDVDDLPPGAYHTIGSSVPDDWRPINGAGAQVNTPRGFTSYATPSGEIVHVSPGGLQYGSDPQFGNRVDHVLAHTLPDPNKPVHSVFNVQGDSALSLVDLAWANRTGPGVLQANGNRVWTVNIGRPVGANGQTAVQIVVRDGTNEIVTAFPR